MDGFLAKQSSSAWSAKGWKERYVAVEGSALKYYEPSFDEAGAPEADGRPPRSFGGAPRRPGPQRAGARPASRLGPIAGRRASLEVEDVAGDGGFARLEIRT